MANTDLQTDKGADLPLCVDLDGCLVQTDTLLEAALAMVRSHPLRLLLVPAWLVRGRAFLKQRMAEAGSLDVTILPYQPDLVKHLREQRAKGRIIVLATAADHQLAHRVAEYLGLFDEVIASDGVTNLKGRNKLRALTERFGNNRFEYAGNAYSDLFVWREASQAILVNAPTMLAQKVRGQSVKVTHVFQNRPHPLKAWLRATRAYQWPKNLLIIVPLFLSHNLGQPVLLLQSAIAIASFTLCTASVYLLNDLLDLDSDRRHATKRFRPLAAGQISILPAAVAVPLLAAASIALSLWLPPGFLLCLVAYLLLTVGYSLKLKALLLVDVVILAGLYTLRIYAGGEASGISISPWTMAFSMFLFLSLALLKRYAELHALREAGGKALNGRAYRQVDIPSLGNFGVSSGYIAVVVLALYVNSPDTRALYPHPQWLWLTCPLMIYWISRLWMLAPRGQMNEDPVLFALTDKVSYLLGIFLVLIVYLAS